MELESSETVGIESSLLVEIDVTHWCGPDLSAIIVTGLLYAGYRIQQGH